jgi:hypothetical protein
MLGEEEVFIGARTARHPPQSDVVQRILAGYPQ